MKRNLFTLLLATLLLQSCTLTFLPGYYQVYTLEAPKAKKSDAALTFSTDAYDIMYNLWGEAGKLSFIVTNKSHEDICIDLCNSFFIHNGMSYNYVADAGDISSTPTRGQKFIRRDVVAQELAFSRTAWPNLTQKLVVPANASCPVYSFELSDVIRQTDRKEFNYPDKASETLTFTYEDTPLRIRNRLSLTVGGNQVTEEHVFWITEIQNFDSDYFYKLDERLFYAPNRYYNPYSTPTSTW